MWRKSHNRAVSEVGVIPSLKYGWQLPSRVVSPRRNMDGRTPDRGKLYGVHLPVGSDEGSP